MVALWIIIIILCLLTATGGALIALRIQYRSLDNSRQEREAWQQAQEGRQRTWEVRQGKHILDAEKKLADQLKDARREWHEWSGQIRQDQQEWLERADIEKELARLPHIEQIELAHTAYSGRPQPKDWRPPLLYRADLHGRDLSHRYLERADLRETNLANASLYMADLTGASLAGANLAGANLAGANLSGVDLRGADLTNANFLVADLHNTVLHGTNLSGARNLSPEQLQMAIYDSTTIIDSSIDITLPRIPGVQITPSELLTATKPANETTHTPATDEANQENETPALPAEPPAALATETAADTNASEENETPPAASEATSNEEESAPTAMSEQGDEPVPEPDPALVTDQQEAPVVSTEEPNEKAQTPVPQDENTDENTEEGEPLPSKIIQWQARAPRTTLSPGPTNPTKAGKQAQKRGNNNRKARSGNASRGQQAQAN